MLDEDGTPVNLLFTKKNGSPTYLDGISNCFKEIVQKYKLPKLTFHGLRHSYASYAISIGINFKVIQEQLGHANIRETLNTYSHIDRAQKEKASDLFDNL
ncbi:MAG: tyrosine-type recombinase/integrase [Solibacillus sp.]